MPTVMDTFDQANLRAALGRFATGVTIITARDQAGQPVGVTANSFNSVSLDPPMVLWSLAKSSRSMQAFESAERFAVHILGADQKSLSDRFASKGIDKFAGISIDPSQVPLLDDCAARFLCRTVYRYEGGDHVIFVGHVLDFTACEKPPLLFHSGRYAEARPRWSGVVDGIDPIAARVGSNSLLNLSAQAQVQILRHVHRELEQHQLQQPRFLALTIVAQTNHPNWQSVVERVRHAGYAAGEEDRRALLAAGWISDTDNHLSLTERGRERYVEVLVRLKAYEDELVEGFTDTEVAEVRQFLQRIIEKTAENNPPLLD